MTRLWPIIALLTAGACLGYLARPSAGSQLSRSELDTIAKEVRAELEPTLRGIARAPIVVRAAARAQAEREPMGADRAPDFQAEDPGEERDADQLEVEQENLTHARDLVTTALDVAGAWTAANSHELEELWAQLSVEGKDQVASDLMAAINTGKLEVEHGARLP